MSKIVFAHRGMSVLAPENTLAAFSLCKIYRWLSAFIYILNIN